MRRAPYLLRYHYYVCVLFFIGQLLKEGDHLVWDKDDKYAMDFVAACANIRAHIFGIALNSRFQIKCKLLLITRKNILKIPHHSPNLKVKLAFKFTIELILFISSTCHL